MDWKKIELYGEKYYGKHMMMTAVRCNENLLDLAKIAEFLTNLADDIDMIRIGDPIVKRFGPGDDSGVSGVQLILTSSITLHTNDLARDMYLDVFSCKWYEEQTVIDVVEKYFSPTTFTTSLLLRK